MRKFLAYLLFGLLPLWAVIALLYVGGKREHVEVDYWNTAPWLILPALLACVATFTVTARAISAYEKAPGSPSARIAESSFSAAKSIAIILFIVIVAVKYNRFQNERDDQSQAKAIAFLRGNEVVRAAVGSNFEILSTVVNRSKSQYDFQVKGYKFAWLRVGASQTPAGTVMILKCVSDHEADGSCNGTP